jgi:hypothetical protein
MHGSSSTGGFYVLCALCTAAGPPATTQAEARKRWDAAERDDQVEVHESPAEPDGVQMRVQFGEETLVLVEYCASGYASVLRGCLTLIGGMRQAEEAEEHDG